MSLPSSVSSASTVPAFARPPSGLVPEPFGAVVSKPITVVSESIAVVVPESTAVVAAAVLLPLVLGSLVYLDARWRRSRSRSASLAPLAWSAAVVCSGVGSPVVVACYVVVRGR